MKRIIKRTWDKWFRGPIGYTGAMGERGADGHLQLSGFPSGTKIVLYDEEYRPLWSGKLKKVKR